MDLIDERWGEQLIDKAHRPVEELFLMAPFIKVRVLDNLIKSLKPKRLKMITRFNLEDFYARVSDTAALRRVLDFGGEVRGISKLHSKLYIFDRSCAFITSANLTDAALFKGNHEFGIKTQAQDSIRTCHEYFDRIWNGGATTDLEQISNWEEMIQSARSGNANAGSRERLPDYGSKSMFTQDYDTSNAFLGAAERAFVKFLGVRTEICELDRAVLEQVSSSGCHWALAYPSSKRPWAVEEGSTMFISGMTTEGFRIFGRAIGHEFDEKRDTATAADISEHPWKDKWGNYVRVTKPEFINGTLRDAIGLDAVMDRFEHEAFMPTLRNFMNNSGGNTNPRKAYMKQPAVELTPAASAWLNDEFNNRIMMHGMIPEVHYKEFYNPQMDQSR